MFGRNQSWQPGWFIYLSVVAHLIALVVIVVRPEAWPWALGVIAVNHLLLSMLGLWPRSNWLSPNWTRLPAAARARNEIALTIDDGPDPVVTPMVLEILDRYQVRASFFCIGEKARQHADICREIVRRGHSVENHSMHHYLHFTLLGVSGLTREIADAQQTVSAITGAPPQFFRAPAGMRNPFLAPVLARLGLRLVSWSVRGFDTRIVNAERVKQRLLGKMKAGAIMLLHDGNAATTPDNQPVIVEVLPPLIKTARHKGLRFVTLPDALG